MTLKLLELESLSSTPALAIQVVLLSMLAFSLVFYLQRDRTFKKIRAANRAFVASVGPLLSSWRLHSIKDLSRNHPASPLAQLMGEMSSQYLQALRLDGMNHPVQMVQKKAESGMREASAELRQGMGLLMFVTGGATLLAFGGIISNSATGLGFALGGAVVAASSFALHRILSNRIQGAERALYLSVHDLLDEMGQSCDSDSERLELAELMWA